MTLLLYQVMNENYQISVYLKLKVCQRGRGVGLNLDQTISCFTIIKPSFLNDILKVDD